MMLEITGDKTNLPADSSGGDRYVLIFCRRDNPSIQPCQVDYYGYLGDKDGKCHTIAGVAVPAITVGG
jgi:hypothetical protein